MKSRALYVSCTFQIFVEILYYSEFFEERVTLIRVKLKKKYTQNIWMWALHGLIIGGTDPFCWIEILSEERDQQ